MKGRTLFEFLFLVHLPQLQHQMPVSVRLAKLVCSDSLGALGDLSGAFHMGRKGMFAWSIYLLKL